MNKNEINSKDKSEFYNNSAIEIFNNISSEKHKDSLLKEALYFLDLAINEDAKSQEAYVNKSSIYIELGEYNKAIEVLYRALEIKKNLEIVFLIGMIYERIGKREQANEKYQEAYLFYEEGYTTRLGAEMDEQNKDFILLFLKGKEYVLERIDSLLKENPEDLNLINRKQMIENIERDAYIKTILK